MMKSSPSNDPHPWQGLLRGKEEEEEEGLKGGVVEAELFWILFALCGN